MKVVRKQNNSKHCLICGLDNPIGLKASFYELEDKRVVSPFEFGQNFQSYPERAHGGMITCICDEIAGRAIWVYEPDVVAVTTSLTIKFRKPVPLDKKLYAVGKVMENSKRAYTAETQVIDAETKQVLASAEITYLKLPAAKITSADMHEELDVFVPDDVTEIDI